MGYSFQDHVNASPGQTAFTFGFTGRENEEYLRDSDIKVEVDGVDAAFTLTGSGSLNLTTPCEGGELVRIKRVMPDVEPYSDFSTGNNFSKKNVNNTNLQQLYLLHQLLDGFFASDFYLKSDLNLGDNIITGWGEGDFDLNGNRIKNLLPGVDAGDAVTVEQLAASSALVSFKYTETLASAKTVIAVDFTIDASIQNFLLFADGIPQFDAKASNAAGTVITSGDTQYINAGSELPIGTEVLVLSSVPFTSGFAPRPSIGSMYELLSIPDGSRTDALLSGFYLLNNDGGGLFYFVPSVDKATANGGTIIDPDTTGGWNGEQNTVANYLNAQGTGVGFGCWVRYGYSQVTPEMFGAVVSSTIDSTISITKAQEAVRITQGELYFQGSDYAHSGLTLNSNMTLRGKGMNATTLWNLSNNPSLSVVRTLEFGSLLNAGVFDMTLRGDVGASSGQHGLIIDGCSTGFLVQRVRTLFHGGDGFRIRYGSIGPMLTNVVARSNNGWGINLLSHDDEASYNNYSSTSARFLNFVCSTNASGGIRVNGGDTQDVDFPYFQYGLVESNGNKGIYILNGSIGASFRDIWIEDNANYGIHCGVDGGAGSQVPLRMKFENIYSADHTTYAVFVERGQWGYWRNIRNQQETEEAYFTNLTAAGGHTIYDVFLPFASGGTGRNVKRLVGEQDETFYRIEPGLHTKELFLGATDSFNYPTSGTKSIDIVKSFSTNSGATSGWDGAIVFPDNTACTYEISVIGKRTDVLGDIGSYKLKGAFYRGTGAGSCVVKGDTVEIIHEDDAAWDCYAAAETANGGLRVLLRSASGQSAEWTIKYSIAMVN